MSRRPLSRSLWPEWVTLLLFIHAFAATTLKDNKHPIEAPGRNGPSCCYLFMLLMQQFSRILKHSLPGPLPKPLAGIGHPLAIYSNLNGHKCSCSAPPSSSQLSFSHLQKRWKLFQQACIISVLVLSRHICIKLIQERKGFV